MGTVPPFVQVVEVTWSRDSLQMVEVDGRGHVLWGLSLRSFKW